MSGFRLDLQNYIILFTAVINLFFALFIYFKGENRKSNISYSIFTFAVALWSIGMFMYRGIPDHSMSLWWARFLYFASGAIPAALFYYSLVFPFEKIRLKKWQLYLIFIPPIFFIFSSFIPNFVVRDIIVHRTIENEMFFGDGYNIWGAYLILYFLLSFINFIRTYRIASNIVKLQIRYILIGSIVSLICGTITNFILPAFGNTEFGWLGQSFTIIMIASATYAIVKYRLMNIRLIITRSILYAVLVGGVSSFFALSVLVVGEAIGGNTRVSKMVTYVVSSFIVVVFLDPVKRTWAKITDKIFYKDKIDYQLVLQQMGAILAREIDLEILLQATATALAQKLKIKDVSALAMVNKNFVPIAHSDHINYSYVPSENFVTYMKGHQEISIVEELIRSRDIFDHKSLRYRSLNKFIKEAETHKVEMVVPVSEQGQLTAIFLFAAKNSGDLYSQDDINFLNVLIPQVATAIEKSKLYEEVEAFNRELQAKVDEHTKSLKEANIALEERNKFLTTMQVVINMTSRTVDLKKVIQMIADSIASELGYVGGILSFVDFRKKVLKVGAVTQNEVTQKAFSLLTKDVKEYESPLKEDYNLGVQTVMTGKMNFSNSLADFLSPTVKKEITDEIQRKLNIKTVVGIPIFAEDKIIGLVRFLLSVERERISALDIEIMTALTNQISIVWRNLKLYDNLQRANKELQKANVYFRALDKAKSEFLSIASHQLRTPISAIKGYLSMMLEGDFGKLSKPVEKVIKDLFESAARLARLINVFLNVSRIESGRLKLEKKPMQINGLVESVITELKHQAEIKKIKLTYHKPKKKIPLIYADSDKLRETILNLVDNAIKYTPEGHIDISVEFDNEKLHFMVKDTGIGIDKQEAPTLFRKFVRGTGVSQIHTGGSGLGLFIAQKIIKEHDGKIWAESAGKGKGSIFQFIIPLYEEGDEYEPGKVEENKEKSS